MNDEEEMKLEAILAKYGGIAQACKAYKQRFNKDASNLEQLLLLSELNRVVNSDSVLKQILDRLILISNELQLMKHELNGDNRQIKAKRRWHVKLTECPICKESFLNIGAHYRFTHNPTSRAKQLEQLNQIRPKRWERD